MSRTPATMALAADTQPNLETWVIHVLAEYAEKHEELLVVSGLGYSGADLVNLLRLRGK